VEKAVTKEQIYDKQVNPLMAKIIAVCQEHKIAMLASFAIPSDDDADLRCTSALLDGKYDPPADLLAAFSMVRDGFVAWSSRAR
jgi:hypothetical protein